MKRKQAEFVAGYQHASAPVEHLSEVLDRYDALSARHTPRDEKVALEERAEFLMEWTSRREDTLRGALEEVAWELEKRDHHAWLEDIGSEEAPELVDDIEAVAQAPRPLAFRFVEAGHTDHTSAPELRFVPDVDASRVHVDAWFGDPSTTEPVRIAPNIRIHLLSEHLVVDLATEFVFDVLRAREPDLRPPEPARPPKDIEQLPSTDVASNLAESGPHSKAMSIEPVEHTHQWSDPGILEHWVDKKRADRDRRIDDGTPLAP